MLLFSLLLSSLWVVSVLGQNQCKPGQDCVFHKDCSSFQQDKKKLDTFGKDTPDRKEHVDSLRAWVCNSAEKKVCCDLPSHRPSLEKEECGLTGEAAGFIVGGDDTMIGEYPFLALLGRNVADGIKFFCGGTLINKWYVITAAHCGKVDFVRLGEWKVVEENDPTFDCEKDKRTGEEKCSEPQQDIPVAEAKPHADYSEYQDGRRIPLNDIMLLKLSRPAEYNEFVQPLCLPSTSLSEYGEPGTDRFDNNKALAVGWGYTYSEKDYDATIVGTPVQQKLELPAVGNSDCVGNFKKFKVDLTDRIKPDHHICAGGERGKDACQGDSGGPLMAREDDLSPWQLVGIVSAGAKRCGRGIPALFTRVTKYDQWLKDNMF